ncbi:MAG: Gfo/Idh/MocA family oxidoreductase [Spirochaetaceae bacterium]|nr:MAG: Gfo/Idh/MocA family oxidoreductase [Spirochaetaceae bacterium]
MALKVGLAGIRGLSTLIGFRSLPDVEVTGFCELDAELLETEAKKHRIPQRFRIFEDMLTTDIDAVVIATPMHFHVPYALSALEAGKHVLSEVPAGVSIDELWWLIEAVEKYKKVYMLAENYCYIPENKIIEAMARKGLFGELYFGEGEYLHDIKDWITYSNGKTSWRKYWQLGKRGLFYPTHSLGPLMKWFQPDRIEAVCCLGSGWHTAEHLRQEDTSVTLCQLASGKLLKLRLDCISNRPHNLAYYSLQGTKGCYEAPRAEGEAHKIWLLGMDRDTKSARFRPLSDFSDFLPERYRNATEAELAADHWGGDFFLIQDFYNAVANGTKPAIDVYEACEWTAVGLLSELSIMNRGRMMEMPQFQKDIPREGQVLKI